MPIVSFTDTSSPGPSGPLTAWAWDFGDDNTSTDKNPVHTYAADGRYAVQLQVTGTPPDGIDNITKSVSVGAGGVQAGFTDSIAGLVVTFTDTSVAGPSGPITGWAWNFGDGGTSTSQNPVHTYAAGGTYTVTLTVTGTTPDGTASTSRSLIVSAILPPPSPPAGGTPGIGLLDYNHIGSFGSHADLYGMVVGSNGTDAARLQTVKGRSLAYMAAADIGVSNSYGVPYAQAAANDWLLKDGSGNFLHNSGYPDYIADIGSAGYRAAFVTNVLAYLSAHPGIDGIFVDDVLYDPKALCGTYPALYPSTSAWADAMVGWAAAFYAGLHAHGYYVCLNGGAYKAGDPLYNDGTSTLNWWDRLGPYADGIMDEYYNEASNRTPRTLGTAWYQQWVNWQRLIPKAQSLGCDFVGLMYGPIIDTAAMTYGKASFLLEWDGGGGVFMYAVSASSVSDPTNTAWTTPIGTPTAAKTAVGVGFRRNYSGGTVLVNPSPTASQAFVVDGVTHTLAATTGLILPSAAAPVGARSLPAGPYTDRTSALVYRMGSDGSGTPLSVTKQHIHDTTDYGLEIAQFSPVTAAPPNTPWQVSDVIGERIGNTPPTSDGTAEAGLWFAVPVNAQRSLGHGTVMGIWAGAQCHDFTLTDVTAAVLNGDGTLGKLPAHGIYLEHAARRGLIQHATIRAGVDGIETEAWRTDPGSVSTILHSEYPLSPVGKAGPCFVEIAYCDIEADRIGIFLDAGMSGFYIHHCKITAPVGISQPANLAMPGSPNVIDLATIEFHCSTANVVTNSNAIS